MSRTLKTALKPETKLRFEMTNFLLQNNLPYSLADRLSSFVKKLVTQHTEKDLLEYSVNRNHVSRIASDFIGPSLQKDYLSKLEASAFSISVDEGCIKGNTEYIAISATFFDESNIDVTEKDKLCTKLIALIELEDSSKGETIFDKIKKFLFSGPAGETRAKNCMGIATDHATNMISSKGAGATNRMQKEFSHIIVTHDLCHALSLALKHSIQTFPKEIYNIVLQISSHFSNSPQRTSLLKNLMTVASNKAQKVNSILRFVPTRWSSFYNCLERIIEMKEQIKAYFKEYGNLDEQAYLEEPNLLMLRLSSKKD